MKSVMVKDVEPGDIFFYQAPDQPLRAWIHLGICDAGEHKNHVWAESFYSYAEYSDWTPRERNITSSKPKNHHPGKYLWLRVDQRVFA